MRRPMDTIPQRQLVYELAVAIDHCMAPGARTKDATQLRIILSANPHSSTSTHVLHNVGPRRARWLLAFVERER